jgi:hypothetical protein
MAMWRLVLPVAKRRMPLARLVSLMCAEGIREPEREARVAELTDLVFRAEHRDRAGNCLERSLVLYRYLGAVGAEPRLMVGLRRDGSHLTGHAWVAVRRQAVREPPEQLEELARVLAFGPRGSLEPALDSPPRAA